MKNIFIVFALISFTIFISCDKEALVDSLAPADEEFVTSNNPVKQGDNSLISGKAAFTINNSNKTLNEGGELLLTNNSINAVSYHWDFGNGDISTEANPTYTNYKIHGPFSITLTITDALGHTHQASQEIVVLCIFGGAAHQF